MDLLRTVFPNLLSNQFYLEKTHQPSLISQDWAVTLKPALDTLMIFILRLRKTNGPNVVSPVYTFIEM